ncbi:hypothetical protein OG747_03130 [Streptomyces sp. NBC_01384]|uniref:hypothetical protein n=1 Tax=Streptomyces sp. NBC_01384 TaxID=2903847 RepID=UPI00324A134F
MTQCTLYQIGIHHELSDTDLAHATLPTPDRRPAPQRTPPALLAAGDPSSAFT